MPPVGSKVRKLVSAQRSLKFGKNVRKDMSLFNIDNPVWDASSNIIEATTNIPTNRVYNKIQNVREVGDERNSNLQRIFLLIGWDKWGLGVENEEFEEAKKQSNRKNKKKNKKRKSIGF